MPKLKSDAAQENKSPKLPQHAVIGINVVDATRLPEHSQFGPPLHSMLDFDATFPLYPGDVERLEDTCTPFACDAKTAASLCDIIREMEKDLGVPRTRVYVRRGERWSRVPPLAMLCLDNGTEVVLNPEYFPPQKVVVSGPAAPTRKRMD